MKPEAMGLSSTRLATLDRVMKERYVDSGMLPGILTMVHRRGRIAHIGMSGHMDLAQRVTDILPLDDVQQKVGKAYLKAYDKALSSSPESKTVEGKKRAEAARQRVRDVVELAGRLQDPGPRPGAHGRSRDGPAMSAIVADPAVRHAARSARALPYGVRG